MESNGAYTKQYQLLDSPTGPITLTGTLNNLGWTPTYILILSSTNNLIDRFTLIAQIQTDHLIPFHVDRITFNTKSVYMKTVPLIYDHVL